MGVGRKVVLEPQMLSIHPASATSVHDCMQSLYCTHTHACACACLNDHLICVLSSSRHDPLPPWVFVRVHWADLREPLVRTVCHRLHGGPLTKSSWGRWRPRRLRCCVCTDFFRPAAPVDFQLADCTDAPQLWEASGRLRGIVA